MNSRSCQTKRISSVQLTYDYASSPCEGMTHAENQPIETEHPSQDVKAKNIVRKRKDLSDWAQAKMTIIQAN